MAGEGKLLLVIFQLSVLRYVKPAHGRPAQGQRQKAKKYVKPAHGRPVCKKKGKPEREHLYTEHTYNHDTHLLTDTKTYSHTIAEENKTNQVCVDV